MENFTIAITNNETGEIRIKECRGYMLGTISDVTNIADMSIQRMTSFEVGAIGENLLNIAFGEEIDENDSCCDNCHDCCQKN